MEEIICTIKDVRDLLPQLYDDEDNVYVIPESRIRNSILVSNGELRGHLNLYYGTDLTDTPWSSIPEPDEDNDSSSGSLLISDGTDEITAASTAVSQLWTITFSDATTFAVVSDLYGAQGNATTSTTFTSTNSQLVIVAGLWSGTFAASDKFYVRTYNYEVFLVQLSALAAAVQLLDGFYTDEMPNLSQASIKYRRQYESNLSKLRNKTITLQKGLSSRDLDPIQVDYVIDDAGHDVTNYADDEWSREYPLT